MLKTCAAIRNPFMLEICTDIKTAQFATVHCDDFMPGSFAMLSVNSQPIHAVASVHDKALPPTYTHPSNHQYVNLYCVGDDDDADDIEVEDDNDDADGVDVGNDADDIDSSV